MLGRWNVWVVDACQVLSILDLVYLIYKVIFTISIRILVLFKVWTRSPETQVVCVKCVKSCDWNVVGHSLNSVLVNPLKLLVNIVHFDLSSHIDFVNNLGSF